MPLTDFQLTLIQAAAFPVAEALRANPAVGAYGRGAVARANGYREFNVANAPGQVIGVKVDLVFDADNDDLFAMYRNLAEVAVDLASIDLAVTGTMADNSATRAEVVAGGNTIIWTLTNNTWHPDAADDEERAKALIRTVRGVPGSLWESLVMPAVLDAWETALVRTSATVMTLTFPAVAGYSAADADTTFSAGQMPPWLLTIEIPTGDAAATSVAVDNTP